MSNGNELRSEAVRDVRRAKDKMAVALALRDGELTDDQADEYLEITDSLNQVQSDCYPGDEYYDQADRALEREI